MTDGPTAELRALAHPLRLRMLSLLTGQAMSAAELARALGCTQANASYHLRLLASVGKVAVTEQVLVRGGRAVRYRYVDPHREPSPVRPSASGGRVHHALFAAALAAEMRRRTELRDTSEPGSTTDAELWVTPQDWQAFSTDVVAASRRLHEQARPARSPGTLRTSTTISLFRMVEE